MEENSVGPATAANKSNYNLGSGATPAWLQGSNETGKKNKKCKSGGKTHIFHGAMMSVLAISQVYVWGIAAGILAIIILYILSQLESKKKADNDSKMDYLYSPENKKNYPQINSIFDSTGNPVNDFELDPKANKGRLADYIISSSYNSCCSGDFLDSYVSLDALKNVINQGVRVLDFSIYLIDEGGKPTAVVGAAPDSSTNIKGTYNHLNLGDVFKMINEKAMTSGSCTNWKDPLFIHLRIMSTKSEQLYKSLAGQFNDIWPDDSSSPIFVNSDNNQLGDIPLSSINGKIVVMITDRNANNDTNADLVVYQYSNIKKFLNRVSSFYDYKNFDTCGHMVKINKTNAHATDIEKIKIQTRKKIYIIVPDELAVNDNMHYQTHHNMGCQMVCMNWQNLDGPLEAYRDKFMFQKDKDQKAQSYAFILKSKQLRPRSITLIPASPLPDDTSTKPQCKTLLGSNLCL